VQSVEAIRDRGVADICTLSGEAFAGTLIDVGRHLRPSWRGGRIVLFVKPPGDHDAAWRAVKLD
jgi:hypothetical protein